MNQEEKGKKFCPKLEAIQVGGFLHGLAFLSLKSFPNDDTLSSPLTLHSQVAKVGLFLWQLRVGSPDAGKKDDAPLGCAVPLGRKNWLADGR